MPVFHPTIGDEAHNISSYDVARFRARLNLTVGRFRVTMDVIRFWRNEFMAKICFTIVLVLLFGLSVVAQTKRKPAAKKAVEPDTILAVVLSDLAPDTVCGEPEWAEKESYIGTVIKRQFDDSELHLSGFIIRDAKDQRTFINIDTDHVSGLARSAPEELSSFLTKGKRVKVWVYRCRRILYAYKIKPM